MSRHHNRLNAHRWAAVRGFVFERDAYRCVMCGKAGRLECDHITPMQREPGQDPFDPNRLQALCRNCHIQKTARENRREPTEPECAWAALVGEMLWAESEANSRFSAPEHPGKKGVLRAPAQ